MSSPLCVVLFQLIGKLIFKKAKQLKNYNEYSKLMLDFYELILIEPTS